MSSCTGNAHLHRACGEAVLAMCGGDTNAFVRLVGLGSAAGLLQQRDMFAAFQHMGVK
jgi:hypothetical protein